MSGDRHVTVKEMNLHLENLSLKVTKDIACMMDKKLDRIGERFDTSNIERRDSAVFEVTGNTWEDREKTRTTIQTAQADQANSDDTKGKLKSGFIQHGTTITMASVMAWLYSQWSQSGN